MIDIGGGTTDILVHYDGGILHSAAVPIAGKNLTLDISHRFKTTLEQAEELKINHGVGKTELASDEKITVKGVKGRESIEISQKDLSEVIEPRMIEILTHSLEEIKKSNVAHRLNFGVVITGGGSQLKNIIDLSQEIFNMPVKIGIPDTINGKADIINNPRYATGIGIIKYVIENKKVLEEQFEVNNNSSINTFISKIKNVFNKIN